MSKRIKELGKLVDKEKLYSVDESISLVKKTASAKFDESVDISIKLGVDPKKSDQSVRGTVVLPSGTGKTKKVCVITKGEKLKEAESSGADFFGSEELIDKIQKGWMEFDSLIATPDIMKDLAKLGKILGPKGLMPNPKVGTVTFEISKAVKEIKAGKVEFKMDTTGIIHSTLGKVSFDEDKLKENLKAFVSSIISAKPPTVKGQYIRSISISSTMGPGVKLDTNQKFS